MPVCALDKIKEMPGTLTPHATLVQRLHLGLDTGIPFTLEEVVEAWLFTGLSVPGSFVPYTISGTAHL